MARTVAFAVIDGGVDKATGVIRGVSVITEGPARGHNVQIDSQTLAQVKACAEQFKGGVKVKIDHGTGFAAIVGVLKDFRIEGQSLRADLHLIKTHEAYPRLLEMAETIPGSFGLSISFSGKAEMDGESKLARCTELYSVDLVDDPAANPNGLFRSVDSPEEGKMSEPTFSEKVKALFGKKQPVDPEEEVLAEITTLKSERDQLKADLSTAKQSISTQAKSIEAKDAEITKLQADHKTAIDALEASVEQRASAKALTITQGQGQPPVTALPKANPGAPAKSDFSNLKGIDKAIAAHKAGYNQ